MSKYSSEKKDDRRSLKVLDATYQALEDAKDRLRRISGRRMSNDKLILAALESLESSMPTVKGREEELIIDLGVTDIDKVIAERLRDLAEEIEHGRKRDERSGTAGPADPVSGNSAGTD